MHSDRVLPFSARNKDFCGNGFILAGCACIDFIRSFFYHQSAADDIVEAKLLYRDFQCNVSRLARGNVFHTNKSSSWQIGFFTQDSKAEP